MKQWWRRWTYEVPLAIGDALWEVLVVQLAALLDRLTVRKVIAFIPVAIIILAYYHRIPIPPELILVGDFLAYARLRAEQRFEVTPIGCGLAGYRPDQIAPMFAGAPANVILPDAFRALLASRP